MHRRIQALATSGVLAVVFSLSCTSRHSTTDIPLNKAARDQEKSPEPSRSADHLKSALQIKSAFALYTKEMHGRQDSELEGVYLDLARVSDALEPQSIAMALVEEKEKDEKENGLTDHLPLPPQASTSKTGNADSESSSEIYRNLSIGGGSIVLVSLLAAGVKGGLDFRAYKKLPFGDWLFQQDVRSALDNMEIPADLKDLSYRGIFQDKNRIVNNSEKYGISDDGHGRITKYFFYLYLTEEKYRDKIAAIFESLQYGKGAAQLDLVRKDIPMRGDTEGIKKFSEKYKPYFADPTMRGILVEKPRLKASKGVYVASALGFAAGAAVLITGVVGNSQLSLVDTEKSIPLVRLLKKLDQIEYNLRST